MLEVSFVMDHTGHNHPATTAARRRCREGRPPVGQCDDGYRPDYLTRYDHVPPQPDPFDSWWALA